MSARVRIAVVGAGLIGRRHADLVCAHPASELSAIVDPAPAAQQVADRLGVRRHPTVAELFADEPPDGVVVATPNALHVEHGLAAVKAGIPVLVEKPIADTEQEAAVLVDAAEAAGVPLLVGHHRRHSPIVAAAREVMRRGTLGMLVGVMGSALFHKPDDYFEATPWRTAPGGGPILINLIHEIDNLRAMCGEIVAVQAISSDAARGLAVEDTVAIVLRFANSALGTFLLSDTAASPRSWEQTSGEDPHYPAYPDEDCYVLAGTHGSLAIPTMRLHLFAGKRSWREPFETQVVDIESADPLVRQLDHFRRVIAGDQPPLVSGREALRSLTATRAVAEAAATGQTVTVQ